MHFFNNTKLLAINIFSFSFGCGGLHITKSLFHHM